MTRTRLVPCMVALTLTLGAFLAAVGPVGPAAASAADPWPYVWPVDAPVIDGFRAPANRFAPGNRGLEFATNPGQSVVAPREGVVTFAGQVAGHLFVTVLHPDGVRTTAGFLASIGVRQGQRLATGQGLGTAATRLHVSARIGEAHVDPAVLFGGASGPPRLVMVTQQRSTRIAPRRFGGRIGGRLLRTATLRPSRPVAVGLHSPVGVGRGA